MNENFRRVGSGLGAIVLMAGMVALWRVSRFGPPLTLPAPYRPGLPGDTGLRFTKVQLVGRSEGKRAWLLDAGQIDSARGRSRLTLSAGIEATALENGASRVTVRAPKAIYEPLLHRITASGGIEATPLERGKPQAVVKAPTAVYALDAKTIRADSAQTTVFESGRPRANVTSAKLLYELKPRVITADGAVEVRLLPIDSKDKLATLGTLRLVWKTAGQSLECPTGGILRRGSFVLEAASLSANLKTGLYTSIGGHGSFELDEVKELNL